MPILGRNSKWYRRKPGAVERWEEIEGDMNEPKLSAEQRERLQRYHSAYQEDDLPPELLPASVRAILARLDWCEAQLAALAPLQDLLLDIREDNDLRRAAEIGAAREREACAAILDGVVVELESRGRLHTPKEVAGLIRARDPCLPPLPDEGELERLRRIEAAARAWQLTSTQQERIEAFKILNEALGLFSGSISAGTRALK